MTVNGARVNLADISAAEGIQMEVRHPGTGEVLRHDDGRPYTITLVSRDSDQFLQLQRQIQDKRAAALWRSRQPLPASAVERDDVELLVAATMSWDLYYQDEATSQPKPENYRKAYSQQRWLRRQVDEFVGNDANFFKTP